MTGAGGEEIEIQGHQFCIQGADKVPVHDLDRKVHEDYLLAQLGEVPGRAPLR
jgi:hypothetical protein